VNVHKEVGTAITINYATTDSQNPTSSSTPATTTGGQSGNGRFSFDQTTTPIPTSEVSKISSLAGVSSVEESLRRTDTSDSLQGSSITTPDGRSLTISPTVYGISDGATHFTLNDGTSPTLSTGSNFTSSEYSENVALVSTTLASTNNLTVGSTFSLKGATFTVVGIYSSGTGFSSSSLIIPMSKLQGLFSVSGYDSITVYANSYEDVTALTTSLKSTLGSAYDVTSTASTFASTISALNVAQNSIRMTLVVAVATAVLVTIFTVFIMIRERTAEIGTLKAIGASHWQVISQFWGEIFTLSAVASLLGVALLWSMSPLITKLFDIATTTTSTTTTSSQPRIGFGGGAGGFSESARATAQAATEAANVHLSISSLNPQLLLIIIGLGMGLALLTSIIPAWYVARLKPAEVLRRA
jgi:ABC-type antimicrobial peptide transport system permease subunit